MIANETELQKLKNSEIFWCGISDETDKQIR